jgi:hypothetical protein
VYPCEVAGDSSLVEPWYNSLSVVAARFLAAGIWRPGRLLRAAMSVLADETCAIAAPRKPRGKRPRAPPPPPPRWSGCRHASDRVALQGDAHSPSSFCRACRER